VLDLVSDLVPEAGLELMLGLLSEQPRWDVVWVEALDMVLDRVLDVVLEPTLVG